jgi:branched-chain amino acid transport system substrate-binding protein
MLPQNTQQNPPTLLLSDKVGPALKLVPETSNFAQGASSTWVAILIFCLIGFTSLAVLIPLSQEIIRSPWGDELRTNLPSLHGLRGSDAINNTLEKSRETSVISESTLTVRIGHVAPTSGPIGHLGQDNEYGARMAIEELNLSGLKIGSRSVKFELLTEDDAANPAQGVAVAQKLVNARVNGVIGHLNSGTTIPASQIYNSAGIPQISPSATNPKYTRQGYSGAFRLVADDAQLGATLGRIAVQNLDGKSIVVIDDRTAYGAGIAEAFKNGVTSAGGTIVAHEFTSDKATDFLGLLNSLKGKEPDIVFFGGMDDVAASILRQMKRLGIQANFIGGDGICTSQLAVLAGNAMIDDSVLCAEAGGVEGSRKAAMDKFRRDFKAKYNADVQVYAPYVYDAVKVMASAIVSAGSAEPSIYLPALKAMNHKGVTGDISFDNKGDVKNGALTIYTYRRGERIQLDVIR